MKMPRPKRRKSGLTYLDGQLLIAMPVMSDKRFARSVIYICAHSEDGAMGLIINQRASHINFPDLLDRLGIVTSSAEDGVSDDILSRSIHVGGPVETGRGFVLHSADYFSDGSTLSIEGGVCLTATIDILKAIASGSGPDRSLLALGYAGWSPGQLEREIHANGWLNCPADADLIFDGDLENKYHRAMAKMGIELPFLVCEAGHA
jgi:putative transcriptional regulator